VCCVGRGAEMDARNSLVNTQHAQHVNSTPRIIVAVPIAAFSWLHMAHVWRHPSHLVARRGAAVRACVRACVRTCFPRYSPQQIRKA
jgi:hypothetical protein